MSAFSGLVVPDLLTSSRRSGVSHLFVHCCLALTTAKKDYAAFSERALILAQQDDIVVVHSPIESRYVDYLWKLGMGPRPERILAVGPELPVEVVPSLSRRILGDSETLDRLSSLLHEFESVCVNPYLCTPGDVELAERLSEILGKPTSHMGGEPRAIAHANQKDLIREKAIELGIPVAAGEVVAVPVEMKSRAAAISTIRRAIHRFVPLTGRVLIRAAEGAFGAQVMIVDSGESHVIQERLSEIEGTPGANTYLVESMLTCTVSPNIGMTIDPETRQVRCVSVTDQNLNDACAHVGNSFPTVSETLPQMVEAAHRFTQWLSEIGATGHIGFDFCEYFDSSTGRLQYFLAEINPRVNGATYVQGIVNRLNAAAHREGATSGRINAFLTEKLHTSARSFAELSERYGEFLYQLGSNSGIVPYGTSFLPSSHLCYLAFVAEDELQLRQLCDKFQQRFEACDVASQVPRFSKRIAA